MHSDIEIYELECTYTKDCITFNVSLRYFLIDTFWEKLSLLLMHYICECYILVFLYSSKKLIAQSLKIVLKFCPWDT